MEKEEIKNVIFEINSECNLECKYCNNIWKHGNKKNIPKNSYSKALKTLKQIVKKADVKNIVFTGGEPFLSERFLEVVLYAKMMKMKVEIISNGMVGDEKEYRRLIEIGVDSIQISLNSFDEDEHNEMTGNKESWGKALNSIKLIKKLGGTVDAVILLTNKNYKNISQTIEFCKTLGAANVVLNKYNIAHRNPNESQNFILDKKDLIWAYKEAEKTAEKLNTKIKSGVCIPHCIVEPSDYKNIIFPKCTKEERGAAVDVDGNVRLCSHSSVVLGNIGENSIKDIMTSHYVQMWEKLIPQMCSDCKKYSNCRGGCKAGAEQLGKSIVAGDPYLFAV